MDRATLESYLAQARSEGRFDSAGTFTIDYAQAREKLAAYQFPSPEYYLLKFVQAAVSMKAGAVEFRFSADSVEVRFVNPGCRLPPEQFGALITDRYDAHLEQHCRDLALAVGGSYADTVCFRDTGSGREVNIRSGCLNFTELGSLRGDNKFLFFLGRDRPHSNKELERNVAILKSACQFSPIPVRLDGRALFDSRIGLEFYERCLESAYPAFWGEAVVAETNRSGLGLPTQGRTARVQLWEQQRAVGEQGEVWVCLRDAGPPPGPLERSRLLLLAGGCLEGPSTLYLVQYGVAISQQTLSTSIPGLKAVLCVDGHPTDISGFQIRDSDLLGKELAEIQRWVENLKLRMLEELNQSEPFYLTAPARPGQSVIVSGVVIGGVLGLVAGPYGSFFGACSGAALARVFQNRQSAKAMLPEQYLRQVLVGLGA